MWAPRSRHRGPASASLSSALAPLWEMRWWMLTVPPRLVHFLMGMHEGGSTELLAALQQIVLHAGLVQQATAQRLRLSDVTYDACASNAKRLMKRLHLQC